MDPFDLPEWLGTAEVTWRPDGALADGHQLRGRLVGEHGEPEVFCDLLAVDEAFPQPVADEKLRLLTHQAWRHHQILLRRYDERLTLCCPGTHFTAELVLDCLDRLARAVGASPGRYSALMRVGEGR